MQTFTLITLLCIMLVFLAAAVMLRNLVKSAIALAGGSVILAILLYLMTSPVAAVFELSVCSGLITVIFISAISMTTPYNADITSEKTKERRGRFIILPLALLLTGFVVALSLYRLDFGLSMPSTLPAQEAGFAAFKDVFWNTRQVDILGQIALILAGTYGVAILFKERDRS